MVMDNLIIKIVTVWYNEEYLSKFFLSHYDYVDEIHVLLDSDTNDSTEQILNGYDNVVIDKISFPDGYDNDVRTRYINEKINEIHDSCDWLYVLDSDEFIFPSGFRESPRDFLKNVKEDIVYANMWQVYRHETEYDLDCNKTPIIYQRRHGDPNRSEGVNRFYCKPIILKCPKVKEYRITVGNHRFEGRDYDDISVYILHFDGAHWAYASREIAYNRIVNRKERFSENNMKKGYSFHIKGVDKDKVNRTCMEHDNDPKLF